MEDRSKIEAKNPDQNHQGDKARRIEQLGVGRASDPEAALAAAREKRLDARWLILANSISAVSPSVGRSGRRVDQLNRRNLGGALGFSHSREFPRWPRLTA